MIIVRAAVLVASVVAPSLGAAQDTKTILEARQGFMTLLGVNMGKLSAMAKGEAEYDATAATQAASNIVALTNYEVWPLFVEGTSADDEAGSEALPVIWEKPDDFRAKFAGLRDAAAGSPEAAAGGQEAVVAVVQKLGSACKACHDTYRKTD